MLKSQHNPHQHTLDHPSSPLSPNFARRVRDDLPAHDGDLPTHDGGLPTPRCPPTLPDMRAAIFLRTAATFPHRPAHLPVPMDRLHISILTK